MHNYKSLRHSVRQMANVLRDLLFERLGFHRIDEVFLHRLLSDVFQVVLANVPALGFRQSFDFVGDEDRVFAGIALLGLMRQAP